jgi:hypothetical protein
MSDIPNSLIIEPILAVDVLELTEGHRRFLARENKTFSPEAKYIYKPAYAIKQENSILFDDRNTRLEKDAGYTFAHGYVVIEQEVQFPLELAYELEQTIATGPWTTPGGTSGAGFPYPGVQIQYLPNGVGTVALNDVPSYTISTNPGQTYSLNASSYTVLDDYIQVRTGATATVAS